MRRKKEPVDPIIVPNLDDPKEQEKWRRKKKAPEDVGGVAA